MIKRACIFGDCSFKGNMKVIEERRYLLKECGEKVAYYGNRFSICPNCNNRELINPFYKTIEIIDEIIEFNPEDLFSPTFYTDKRNEIDYIPII